MQILGLVGHDGISPLDRYLPAAHGAWETAAYWRLPTLFWLDPSDTMLVAGAWLGAALGALVMIGVLVRPSLIALFALYLSYTYAGQIFMNFQWDQLLLESGFLAIFLTGGTRIDFDCFTSDGLDGFDFVASQEPVYFDVLVDGTRRPDLVFFTHSGQGASAATDPFGLSGQ